MADDSNTYDRFDPFIEGYNYPVTDDFSQTLASQLNLSNDAYINRLLSEDYHCPPPAIDFIQSSDFSYGHLPSEKPTAVTRNSAFTPYNRKSLFIGLQSAQEKQKLIKRCLDFVRGMDKSSRSRLSWDDDSVNVRMLEESHAYTHLMVERKRRNKLNQHFTDLRSLLPQNSKLDRQSILSGTILQLNHLKHRKENLEQKNKDLVDMYTRSISEGYSSSSLHGRWDVYGSGASTRDEKMRFVSDQDVVVCEKSNMPEEDYLQVEVTLKRKKDSSNIDVMLSLLNCLKELKLEVLRFHSGSVQ